MFYKTKSREPFPIKGVIKFSFVVSSKLIQIYIKHEEFPILTNDVTNSPFANTCMLQLLRPHVEKILLETVKEFTFSRSPGC